MEDINFGNVWREAWNETRFVVKLVYQSLWQMITGKIGVDQMAGHCWDSKRGQYGGKLGRGFVYVCA